jgi:hypothetical protein
MTRRTGACLCGAVRYTLDSDPVMMAVCHCTHCQKQSGSVFSANIAVPDTAYQQQGETRIYQDRGDSGQPVYRHFCPSCGSPILSRLAIMPGLTLVKAGTLDDLSGLIPGMEVYVDHAVAWVSPVAGAQRFGRTRPGPQSEATDGIHLNQG